MGLVRTGGGEDELVTARRGQPSHNASGGFAVTDQVQVNVGMAQSA